MSITYTTSIVSMQTRPPAPAGDAYYHYPLRDNVVYFIEYKCEGHDSENDITKHMTNFVSFDELLVLASEYEGVSDAPTPYDDATFINWNSLREENALSFLQSEFTERGWNPEHVVENEIILHRNNYAPGTILPWS